MVLPRISAASTTVAVLIALAVVPSPAEAAQAPERLILEPGRGTIFTVEGIYPPSTDPICTDRRPALRAKYRGALEIRRGSDGRLRITNELSFSHYLRGLAEVPLSWPTHALRAQVIAARSYAMDAYLRGRSAAAERGYHICATDQCQVYRGATIELGAFGDRWVEAVRETKGRVLRYGGRVIQAFYFSTSDGRTRRSFPGGTPQPWLPSVDGNDDDAPLARWTAPIRLAHLAEILRVRGEWSGGAIERVQDRGDDVRIVGTSGQSHTMSKRDFRIDVNAVSRCLFPDTYPNPSGTQSGGRLPQTIPSSSFTLRGTGERIVASGRGWGHFVGMSQWGARALADRGRTAEEILDHYYGAAAIQRIREPRAIRVLAAEDLMAIRIAVDGPVTVRTDTGSELAAAERFTIRDGNGLRIRRGVGPRLDAILAVQPRTTQVSVAAGDRPRLRFETNRPARIRVRVTDPAGGAVYDSKERSYESGRHRIRLRTLPPGSYEAVVVADDGLDIVHSVPIPVAVAVPPLDAVTQPVDQTGGSRAGVLIAIGAALLAITGASWWLRRRLSRT